MGVTNEEIKNLIWNTKNELKYVSDKSLKIALYFLEKDNLSIEVDKENDKLIIWNNIINLCNNQYTEDELIDAIENNNWVLNDKKIIRNNKGSFKRKINYPLDHTCANCKFQKCPKYLMGYLYYLREIGLLEEKLKEREKFRKNNKVNDEFAFVLKWDNILMNASEELYNLATKMVKNDLVYVERDLNNDGLVVVRTSNYCKDFKVCNGDINKLQKNFRNKADWFSIKRKVSGPTNLCKDYVCALSSCPILLAGYLYYLNKIKDYNKIYACRQFYKENKEKIDKENSINSINRIQQIGMETYQNVNELLKYKDLVTNMDKLIELVSNNYQNSLHIILNGDLDDEKNKHFMNEITGILYNLGKLDSDKPSFISLQKLASACAETDKNNGIEYHNIVKKKVHIITGIKEFINDYNLYNHSKISGIYLELRKKQFDHIIDVLTSMNADNYIILVCNEKEVELLLNLDPRIKYIYQNKIFEFLSLTKEELYDEFVKNIKNSLVDDLRKNNSKVKKEFLEYISLNEKFLPFKNLDLVKYLAQYCNIRNTICFPDNMYKQETIEESFSNIIGMENVKDKLREFEKYMLFQAKAKANDLKLSSNNMHMVFTGNPGTGKTTIARIIAKMLYDLGMIKENKLIEVSKKDLIAEYIGQTAPKTMEVIEKAIGGVLFIDEAYSITQGKDGFGLESVATLIKAMEDYKDQLVVIFAGYKAEMHDFINSNPGIASRIGYTFDFPDYTVEELIEIYKRKMNNMGFEIDSNSDIELRKICSYFSRRKSFGNGRFVDKIIQETIIKHSQRDTENIKIIETEDIPSIEMINNSNKEDSESLEELLNNIIGMEQIKEKLKDFETYIKFVSKTQKTGIALPDQNMHMIFTGNPGTGKTTIARIIAKMLYEIGMVHENKLIEVDAKDLIAGYIGQTALKTNNVIEKAMGGVLFIDEAYGMLRGNNSFGEEAIDTLIKAMEDYKNQFVVIFAGYKREMKSFIESNSGLYSRIGYTFDFQDYTDDELEKILYKKIELSGMKIQKNAVLPVSKIMKYFGNVENIGNGRFVDKVFQEILMKHAKNNSKDLLTIKKQDIPSIEEMTRYLINGNNMINPNEIGKDELKKTAVHEVGHAVARLLLFKEPGIKKITINAEGTGTLGYVMYKNTGGYTQSKQILLNRIKVSLAGIGAEKVFYDDFENGGTSDLEKATDTARNMITRYGMSDLGLARIKNPTGELEKNVYDEINKILNKCFEEVIQLLRDNKDKIENVVNFLLKNKEITEEELIKNFQ